MTAGITGHQELGDETTIAWIEKEMLNELNKLNIEKAFSSLAVGADQLFATLILSKQIPLVAIIPSYNYQKTFQDNHLKTYYSLLKQASDIIQLEFNEPGETAYYEAGKVIVEKSDIMFAVWNNKPAKGLGGTADIVAYAKLQDKRVIHFNLVTQTINYINV
jgi:hypothetical protein